MHVNTDACQEVATPCQESMLRDRAKTIRTQCLIGLLQSPALAKSMPNNARMRGFILRQRLRGIHTLHHCYRQHSHIQQAARCTAVVSCGRACSPAALSIGHDKLQARPRDDYGARSCRVALVSPQLDARQLGPACTFRNACSGCMAYRGFTCSR